MSLGNVLGAAAPIAAGYFLGPAAAGFTGGATSGAIAAGALTGAGIAALTGQDILTGGITGGLGGLGGGGISGAMDAAKAAKLATVTPGATTAGINTGLQNVASANLAQAGLPQNLGMMSSPSALGAYQPITGLQGAVAPNMGFVNKPPVGPGVGMTAKQATSGLPSGGGYTFKDFERAALPTGSTDIGINDIAGQLGKNAETGELNPALGYGKMALTASGPIIAGLEPEYETFEEKRGDKYDSTRRLNLDEIDTGIGAALKRDTGLRLVKEGGHIKGYKGGGPLSRLLESGNTRGTMTNTSTGQVTDMSGQSMLDMLRQAGVVKYEDGGAVAPVTSGESYAAGYTAEELGYTPEGFKPTTGLGEGETLGTDAYAAGLDVPPGTELTADGKYVYPIIPSYYYSGTPRRAFTPASTSGIKSLKGKAAGGMRTTTEATMAGGGYLETGGRIGDGMSDDIKATINNEQEARLSDGEFVVPADVVSHLGNGSSDAGAKRLYDMMDKIRQARTGTIKQGREINPERYMPA